MFCVLCCAVLSHVQLFCDPMDYNLPGSSVHGILQARVLEWVAISSSRGSSWPRDLTWVSDVSCIGRFFTTCATWDAHVYVSPLFWISFPLRSHGAQSRAHSHWFSVLTGFLFHLWLFCIRLLWPPVGQDFLGHLCRHGSDAPWLSVSFSPHQEGWQLPFLTCGQVGPAGASCSFSWRTCRVTCLSRSQPSEATQQLGSHLIMLPGEGAQRRGQVVLSVIGFLEAPPEGSSWPWRGRCWRIQLLESPLS